MKVLVSGAGMAGLIAGIALGQSGFSVTLVERAKHLRVNGSPIDIRGDAVRMAREMGVLEAIRARRVTMSEEVVFVDRAGKTLAAIPQQEINDSEEDVEIPREDLGDVLHRAQPAGNVLRFGDWIEALHDDGDGVDVTFKSGLRERYDLVVGADGVHSATRRLIFGPEKDYLKHLGFYIALTDLPEEASAGRVNPMFNFPGHLIGIARYRHRALGVFNFRSAWIDYDYHDLAAQKAILAKAFAGHDEWKVREIVAAALRDPELYFDSVSQIHMPTWRRGRVVLVGDAAACATGLSGRGTSLAITGTCILAEALRRHAHDFEAAFAEYEQRQRPYVEHAQAIAVTGGDLICPATWEAIEARNARLTALPSA